MTFAAAVAHAQSFTPASDRDRVRVRRDTATKRSCARDRGASTRPALFGSAGSAPIPIDVAISNQATVPLRVVRIRIESAGMVQYVIPGYERTFSDTLGPGESRVFNLLPTAYRQTSSVQQSEPLTMRVFIEFEAEGKHFQEIRMQQLEGA